MNENIQQAVSKFWGNRQEIPIADGGLVPSAEAIYAAVKNAVKDLMARTLKRCKDTEGDIIFLVVGSVTCPLRNLYSEKKPRVEFDKWHNETCAEVLSVLQSQYTNIDGTKVHYGKAQKIVNMTLKYLYCMKGADKYEANFEHCHMPLDSYTLEWIKRACKKAEIKLTAGKIPSWSVLDYDDNNGDLMVENGKEKYTYNFFVKKVRDLAGSNYGFSREKYGDLTPLQAEFLIWPRIQMELAAEAFIIQFKSNYDELTDEEKKEIKNTPLQEKLETVKDLLCKVNFE